MGQRCSRRRLKRCGRRRCKGQNSRRRFPGDEFPGDITNLDPRGRARFVRGTTFRRRQKKEAKERPNEGGNSAMTYRGGLHIPDPAQRRVACDDFHSTTNM